MKEVAWIFGNSAAGKETLIRNVLESGRSDLKEALGWVGKRVSASDASLSYIGQFDGDPVTLAREKILDEVPALLQGADVVLVKWQGVDSGASRVERLRRALPDVHHRIVQIVTSDGEVAERLPHKSWWDDGDDPAELIAEEHVLVADCIAELNEKLPVTRINGSSFAEYTILGD